MFDHRTVTKLPRPVSSEMNRENVAKLSYGSLSAVLVLLIWMHVSALILIWGGEFSAEYARYRRIHT